MNEELKVSHKGNGKLGKNISTLSRSVGEHCPDSCHFLNNGCYAQKVEKIYTNTRKAYEHNANVLRTVDAWQKLRAFFMTAHKKGNAVRLHVNGDVIRTTESGKKILDRKYINDLCKALESIPESERPRVWMYTHVPNRYILKLAKAGVKVYGSVDTPEMLGKFKKAGFKFFAFTTTMRKGKDRIKSIKLPQIDKPVPVCPEQIGTKKSCEDCNICINQTAHVAFLNH